MGRIHKEHPPMPALGLVQARFELLLSKLDLRFGVIYTTLGPKAPPAGCFARPMANAHSPGDGFRGAWGAPWRARA
jgi:hypothetical protein